jgi:hypothetical protein
MEVANIQHENENETKESCEDTNESCEITVVGVSYSRIHFDDGCYGLQYSA